MKKILIVLLITGFAFSANAQGVANATADIAASANIITPISVTGTALAFGDIATSGIGTITLATDSKLASSGLAKHMDESGTAGTITVLGEKDESFALTIAQKTALTIGSSTADDQTMTMSNFTSSGGTGSNGSYTDNTIPTGGSLTLNIGATLTTKASQVAGAYAGSITIVVSYE